jgi:glucokinase
MVGRLVLCGDIGGTKTLLGLAAADQSRLAIVLERRYSDEAFPDFADLLRAFFAEIGAQRASAIESACLGVAGPVEGRRVRVTNFPWELDATVLEAVVGAPVTLVNDFEAAAHGIGLLQAEDLVTIQRGEPQPRAPQLVIGAGTGLGVAYRVWGGDRYLVLAGEGGHAGFAPADERQADLWRAVHREVGRVSIEHIVSGAGLARIRRFLRGAGAEPVSAEEIARAALEHADPRATDALDLFVACYGAAAGDYALAVLARGGVYVTGGIAPKILPRLRAGPFLAAFNAAADHAGVAARLPVHVVVNQKLGLLGAAQLAAGV